MYKNFEDFLFERNFYDINIKRNKAEFYSEEKKNVVLFIDDYDYDDFKLEFKFRKYFERIKELDFDNIVVNVVGRYYFCDYNFCDENGKQLNDFDCKINLENEFDFVGEKDLIPEKYIPLNNSLYGLGIGQNINDFFSHIYLKNIETAGIADNNLIIVLEYYLRCKSKGMNPLVGRTFHTENCDIVLYAKNYNGFTKLMYLNYYESLLIKDEQIDWIPFNILEENSKDLICVIVTDSGKLFELIKANDKSIKKYISRIMSIYEKTYLSFQFYKFYNSNLFIKYDRFLKNLLNIFMGFNFIFFNRNNYSVQSISKSYISLAKTSNPNFEFNEEHHILEYGEIFEILNDYDIWNNKLINKEFIDNILENTFELNNLVSLEIPIEKYELPEFDTNNKIRLFEKLIKRGLKNKMKYMTNDESYVKNIKDIHSRIDIEKKVIYDAGFVDYFLIIYDIIKWAHKNNIYCGAARGSVAGSLVAYLLNITNVNPLKFDLLFERFLNKARVHSGANLPDIDMDFESEGRDKIKKYVFEKYGMFSTCSIGTYGKLQIRAAIKDIGKVFGLSFDYCNEITGKIFGNDFDSFILAAQKHKEVAMFIKENPVLIKVINDVNALPKNQSIHPAGVFIVPKKMQLWDYVPVRWLEDKKSKKWNIVSEWEGKYIDKRGILKLDILGIKQLDIFKQIELLIAGRYLKQIEFNDVINSDLENKKVLREFENGTEGVFQFKTPGLKSYMKFMKPRKFNDLVAANALYRPGAMISDSHIKYVHIKNGDEKVNYDHELLKNITKNTYGLYIYQEQIMQSVVSLGNLSMEDADIIRSLIKKVDKNSKEKMINFGRNFIKGAIRNGCTIKEAKLIWNKLLAFIGYGFNKSHSCSYSMASYYCQWLKVNYPIEFFEVNLNFCNDEEIVGFILKLPRFNLKYSFPDINKSKDVFYSNKKRDTIYWSLSRIKGVGLKAAKDIVEVKRKGGKFLDFEDFYTRVTKRIVNKKVVENLIFSGCFDNLCNVDESTRFDLLRQYHTLKKEKSVLGLKSTKSYYESLMRRLLIIDNMFDYEEIAQKMNVSYDDIDTFRSLKKDTLVNFIGVVNDVRKLTTKKGLDMIVINLENNNNRVPLVIFPRQYDLNKKKIEKISIGNALYCRAIKSYDGFRHCDNLISNDSFKLKIRDISF